MQTDSYQISWEVYGKNDSRLTHTLNSTTHEYKIQGLSSLTTYTIDVAAVTAAGVGLTTSSTISSGVPPGLGRKSWQWYLLSLATRSPPLAALLPSLSPCCTWPFAVL
ncbi:hypothetical protein A6R68_11027 [Neotoma lepida]|uniref:Fibronectin type-III domain-containing protein n=1 Tax=Neotoma lepida TaxID=56216 RepID=A0A1A6FW81_NEOLE|nr:hypothetical protein A6R68_11027 [Neotoma lepida]